MAGDALRTVGTKRLDQALVARAVRATRVARLKSEACSDQQLPQQHKHCAACKERSQANNIQRGAHTPDVISLWFPEQGAKPRTACRFTVRHSREVILTVGPTSYNPQTFSPFLNKVRSSRGVSIGLAPRFYQRSALSRPQLARPTARNKTQVEKFSQKSRPCPPFGSTTTRPDLFVCQRGPGPGCYDTMKPRCTSTPTLVICTGGCTNQLTCSFCGENILGNFWVGIQNRPRLCKNCVSIEIQATGQIFKKARDCTNLHQHNGSQMVAQLCSKRHQMD